MIDSDGFFALKTQPKKVAVIGAGYIAVELAGVFNGLGTDTSLFVRRHCALREFDEMISSYLDSSMKKSGEDGRKEGVVRYSTVSLLTTFLSALPHSVTTPLTASLLPSLHDPPGIKVNPGSTTKKVVREQDGTLTLHLVNGEVRIVWGSVDRQPHTWRAHPGTERHCTCCLRVCESALPDPSACSWCIDCSYCEVPSLLLMWYAASPLLRLPPPS
mgnify:CR=1 FL=1